MGTWIEIRCENRALWPLLVVAVVSATALIWFVAVPIATKIVENQQPATAESIKAAVGDSLCKRHVVEVMTERGQILTNMDLVNMQEPCKVNDEQRSALAK